MDSVESWGHILSSGLSEALSLLDQGRRNSGAFNQGSWGSLFLFSLRDEGDVKIECGWYVPEQFHVDLDPVDS